MSIEIWRVQQYGVLTQFFRRITNKVKQKLNTLHIDAKRDQLRRLFLPGI